MVNAERQAIGRKIGRNRLAHSGRQRGLPKIRKILRDEGETAVTFALAILVIPRILRTASIGTGGQYGRFPRPIAPIFAGHAEAREGKQVNCGEYDFKDELHWGGKIFSASRLSSK